MPLLSEIYDVTLKRINRGQAKLGNIRPTIGEFFMTHKDYSQVSSYRSPTGIESVGTGFHLNSVTTSSNCVKRLNDNYFIWARSEGTGTGNGKVSICALNKNGTVTEGTKTTFDSSFEVDKVKVEKLSDNKIILAWIRTSTEDACTCVTSVANNNIGTVGTVSTVSSHLDNLKIYITKVSDSSVVFSYSGAEISPTMGGSFWTRAATISDTNVTVGGGSRHLYGSTSSGNYNFGVSHVGNNKMFLTFHYGFYTTQELRTKVGTVSGSSLSWGDAKKGNQAGSTEHKHQVLDSGKVLYTYRNTSNNDMYSIVFTLGTDKESSRTGSNRFSTGTYAFIDNVNQLENTYYTSVYRKNGNQCCASFATFNVDTNVIESFDETLFGTGASASNLTADVINDYKIVAIRTNPNNNYAACNIITIERE